MKYSGLLKSMSIKHSASRKFLLIVVFLGILFFTLFVSCQYVLFERALDSVSAKFASRGYQFKWNDTRLKFFNRISAGRIMLKSLHNNTKLTMDSLSMQFGFFSAIRGQVKIKELSCCFIEISLAEPIVITDEDTMIAKGQLPSLGSSDYAGMLNRMVRRLFMSVPRKLNIDTIEIKLSGSENVMLFSLVDSRIDKGIFSASLYTGEVVDSMAIFLQGKISRKEPAVRLLAHHSCKENSMLHFPGKDRVRMGFDTLLLSFSFPQYSHRFVTLEGTSLTKNFILQSERLSSNPIHIHRILTSFILHIEPQSIELDSISTVTLNDISLHPYVCIKKDPALAVRFKICPVSWDAGDFFRSLPEGMFTSLAGFNATGNLNFFLDFSVDRKWIDSLYFTSKLTADEFRIVHYGTDDYRILNTEFTHKFYDRDGLAAIFIVGPANPDFTPLAEISPWLKIAVLTSEDGGFYFHKGFNPGAIRESMITNLKERKFVRGGSTISMQLVKNVFLTRNKTVGRKLEELLIVWIIENNHLVSKDRMFELYLNIIEWGPGVFGINQASRYYFNKAPAGLSLQEGIFLAGIVPFPKRFKSVFECNGQPKAYFSGYMQRMKELMVARNYIQPKDTMDYDPYVFLNGPASRVFALTDTAAVDTVSPDELMVLPGMED